MLWQRERWELGSNHRRSIYIKQDQTSHWEKEAGRQKHISYDEEPMPILLAHREINPCFPFTSSWNLVLRFHRNHFLFSDSTPGDGAQWSSYKEMNDQHITGLTPESILYFAFPVLCKHYALIWFSLIKKSSQPISPFETFGRQKNELMVTE